MIIALFALFGVIVSLLLQVRQLRVSRLEASRSALLEIVKLFVAEPTLFMDPSDTLYSSPDAFRRELSLNLYFKYLEMSYTVGAISKKSVQNQVRALFGAAYRRHWWDAVARDHWRAEANTRNEREFVLIVNEQWAEAEAEAMPDMDGAP